MLVRLVKFFHVLLRVFFNDTATTEIYTLSLHDALPIFGDGANDLAMLGEAGLGVAFHAKPAVAAAAHARIDHGRSEEHTSELQSRQYLVCRLLIEKKTTSITKNIRTTINVLTTISE